MAHAGVGPRVELDNVVSMTAAVPVRDFNHRRAGEYCARKTKNARTIRVPSVKSAIESPWRLKKLTRRGCRDLSTEGQLHETDNKSNSSLRYRNSIGRPEKKKTKTTRRVTSGRKKKCLLDFPTRLKLFKSSARGLGRSGEFVATRFLFFIRFFSFSDHGDLVSRRGPEIFARDHVWSVNRHWLSVFPSRAGIHARARVAAGTTDNAWSRTWADDGTTTPEISARSRIKRSAARVTEKQTSFRFGFVFAAQFRSGRGGARRVRTTYAVLVTSSRVPRRFTTSVRSTVTRLPTRAYWNVRNQPVTKKNNK